MECPKGKKEWSALMSRLGLEHWKCSEGRGWLTHLPYHTSSGKCVVIKPVPYVMVKTVEVARVRRVLAKERLHLAWSALHLVEGYHHPKGMSVFTLTRPPERWWYEREGNAEQQEPESGAGDVDSVRT